MLPVAQVGEIGLMFSARRGLMAHVPNPENPMTDTIPDTISTNDTWAAELAQLRARYRHVREPILVALNILLHDENVTLDDAKARAAMRGARITAASVSAAQRLLARRDGPAGATVKPAVANPKPASAPPRRTRPADQPHDAEALIRGVVAKLQTQGGAEAQRLRDAIRKAIAALQGAVGS